MSTTLRKEIARWHNPFQVKKFAKYLEKVTEVDCLDLPCIYEKGNVGSGPDFKYGHIFRFNQALIPRAKEFPPLKRDYEISFTPAAIYSKIDKTNGEIIFSFYH